MPTFANHALLEAHIKSVHNRGDDEFDGKNLCCKCGLVRLPTQQASNFRSHVAFHDNRPRPKNTTSCRYPGCDATFADRGLLEDHVKLAHNNGSDEFDGNNLCHICGKVRENGTQTCHFRLHVSSHDASLPCTHPGCSYVANHFTALKRHMRSHSAAERSGL